jgi:hypothetical protein
VQKSSVAKYGLVVSFDVRFCQPVKVAGNVCVAATGGVAPAACEASNVAAGWLALSVRQKFDASAPVMPPPFAVPSVR